MMYLIKGFAKA